MVRIIGGSLGEIGMAADARDKINVQIAPGRAALVGAGLEASPGIEPGWKDLQSRLDHFY
jgi:hypothetical protein